MAFDRGAVGRAFSEHRFDEALPHLAKDVRWTVVGYMVLEGADAMRQLLVGELGEVLRNAADALGIGRVDEAAAWQRALLEPDAFVLELNGDAVEEVGVEDPEHVELELVRQAQGLQHTKRMPWLRRTYRRWTALHSEHGRSAVRWVRPDTRAV